MGTPPLALTDEEIEWLIAAADDDTLAAALVGARSMAARFSKLVDSTVGDIQKSYSQLYKHFAEVVERLSADVDTVAAARLFRSPGPAASPTPSGTPTPATPTSSRRRSGRGMDDRPGTVATRDGRC